MSEFDSATVLFGGGRKIDSEKNSEMSDIDFLNVSNVILTE